MESRVYLTWDGLNANLAKMTTRDELIAALSLLEPDAKPKKLMNHALDCCGDE